MADVLVNIRRKLDKLADLPTLTDTIARTVAERGKDIANKNYSRTHVNMTTEPSVYTTSQGKGKTEIIAYGDGIAFEEFGTGTKGENSPHPRLPKVNVPITGKWIYNYPSTFKKTNKKGGIYWVYAGRNRNGQIAGKQMYETAIELRANIPSIVKNVIKEL